MNYTHSFLYSKGPRVPVGKVVCIGKNYRTHPGEHVDLSGKPPVLFMKPSCALVSLETEIRVPDYSTCYYEVELAVLIGSELEGADERQAEDAIAGYALALDLTLKEMLDQLKRTGLPWELAKSFDRSCPISPFLQPRQISDPKHTNIQLTVNGEVRQEASTELMIRNTFELVSLISRYFTLYPGDVVLTGTPAGAGILPSKSLLQLKLDERYQFNASVI